MTSGMTSAIYLGSARIDAIALTNRGLNYGDGVFETMRVHHGTLPLWQRHHARLREGAQRLGISLPDSAFVETQMAAYIAGIDAGVLKLLLTRGNGGRGYAAAEDALPVWVLSLHPLPLSSSPLKLHLCDTRLALQPALAGIKHCNRLEQILARAEVQRMGCDEGLMCDAQGRVVSATAANLLAYRNGAWWTSSVASCGIAGVLRGWLLEQGLVHVGELTLTEVESADALALCNAVRGILPVTALDGRTWAQHPATTMLQTRLTMAYPMFSNPAGKA